MSISPKRRETSKEDMKRLGHLWDEVLSLDNGFVAVAEGTVNKRNDWITKQFYFDDEIVAENPTCYHVIDPVKAKAYVSKLIPGLRNQTWKPKPPRYIHRWCPNKTKAGGKWRDLYVPAFDDHIIAHMVMKAAMPAFTRGMHPHCCGSVPNRGIKHIVRTVSHWMQDDKECRYFVKLDIRHFFDNIQADKLMEILRKHIKDKYVLWAFEQIIRSAPVACPVGYYTSPFFANLYLQDFDWFIEKDLYKIRRGKRIKYVRHYLRYMDDMLLIGTSKSDLRKAVEAVKDYLWNNFRLSVKNSWEIKAIGKHWLCGDQWILRDKTFWCDIGGYEFCKDSTIIRDRIYLSSMRLARKMFKTEYFSIYHCCSIISRIGWASHCSNYHYLEKIKSFINLKTIRRIISYGNMEKSRKRRSCETAGSLC